MKIEVLYFDGCPNHKPAVARVWEVLHQEKISAEVAELIVRDEATAQAAGFLGSPSIRVNGLDVEPAARSSLDYGMVCRTYVIDGGRQGMPSREMIQQAIREAEASRIHPCCQSGASGRTGLNRPNRTSFLMASSVVASIVASFCCILPIIFALTGLSVLGASAQFAAWRPYLLVLTFGLLGLGFYFAYQPRRTRCAPDSTCSAPVTPRSGRVMLWSAAAVAILFAAFPYYSGSMADFLASRTSRALPPEVGVSAVSRAVFAIEGMDCAACATAIDRKLKAAAGVLKVTVSFEQKKAVIDYDAHSATPSQLVRVIEDAGYRARVE